MSPQREVTAYHEAGHGVAAFALHRRFTLISIEGEPLMGAAGHIMLDPPRLDLESGDQRLVAREILIRLAGLAAEALQFGHNPWQATVGDLPQARAMLAFLPDASDPDAHLDALYQRTLALLREHWPAVVALAAALLAHGALGEGEARHLMREALR